MEVVKQILIAIFLIFSPYIWGGASEDEDLSQPDPTAVTSGDLVDEGDLDALTSPAPSVSEETVTPEEIVNIPASEVVQEESAPVPPTDPVVEPEGLEDEEVASDEARYSPSYIPMNGEESVPVDTDSLFSKSCEEVSDNDDYTEKQQECLCSKEKLEGHQRDIFSLTANNGATLLELLKKRDQYHAELSMTDSLLDIWDKYRNFLTQNEQLVNQKNLNTSVQGLQKIKEFIQDNKGHVSRYHLVSEVMSTIPNRQDIRNFETDEEKIGFIKDSIRNHCANAQYTQSLYMCQGDAWGEIRLEPVQNQNPSTPGAFLNKLANTIVKLDGNMDLNSIPSLFVDREEVRNPTGLNQFADDITSLIDKSIEACRQKVLLGEGDTANCINSQSAGEEATRIVRTLKGMGVTGNLSPEMNVGQITQLYLDVAKRTKAFHEEVAGGSVDRFVDLINQVGSLQNQTLLTNDRLEDSDNVNRIRNEFNRFSETRLEMMADHLNKLGTDVNNSLFSHFDGEESNQPFNQKANTLLNEILGVEDANIFMPNEEGKLSINPSTVPNLIRKLIEKNGEIERKKRQLQSELRNVNQNIAQVKATKEYQDSNALKDFLWDKVAGSCAQLGGGDTIRVSEASECQLNNNGQGAITDLMMVNDQIIGYRERQSRSELIKNVAGRCRSIVQNEVQNQKWGDLCSEATRKSAQQVRREATNAYYRNSKNHDVIYSYDSEGRVVDKYTPKSNLALFLPQAAYTINEQLPFYFIQRPAMNMAIDQWRFLGKQQKTQQAYWDAWNQSWQNNSVCGVFGCFYNTTLLETASPTFGNSGFNFGSTTTTPMTF